MNYLTYHDLEKEDKHGFTAGEESLTEQSLVVREMIIPGMLDYPDMYVRHINLTFREQQYLIISMTDYELDEAKKFRNMRWCSEIFKGKKRKKLMR